MLIIHNRLSLETPDIHWYFLLFIKQHNTSVSSVSSVVNRYFFMPHALADAQAFA